MLCYLAETPNPAQMLDNPVAFCHNIGVLLNAALL